MDLIEIYLAAVPCETRERVVHSALVDQVAAFFADARAAVPLLDEALVEFVRDVASRAVDGTPPPIARAADLAVAFAAGRGERGALAQLDAILVESARRATMRVDPSTAFADLVTQDLRTHLLVGEAPRIREYAGRGSLAAWLYIAARRVALNLRRGAETRRRSPLPSKLCAVVDEPEVALLRARYRGDFEDALRVALSRLPSRERMALCLSLRDGLSSNQLAALYVVSRATAKRILVRARETLLAETQRELRARLGITTSEFESVARAVCDDIDVSIVRLLEEAS